MRWLGPAIAALVTLLFGVLTLVESGWGVVWFGILTIGGVVETIALVRQAKGDTLSESVWNRTRHPLAKVALALALIWLFFHFVFGI